MLNYVKEVLMSKLLIIFVKNPKLGKVKSRLALKIGAEKALSVYKKLLQKTQEVVSKVRVNKKVCYSESIDRNDLWVDQEYEKDVQQGDNLGERMHNAIANASKQYDQVCLIGSDNMEITPEILSEAFDRMNDFDIVFGPSRDGGYYLVGMKKPVKEIFDGICWSTPSVLKQSIDRAKELHMNYYLLPELNDIDQLEDIADRDKVYLLS